MSRAALALLALLALLAAGGVTASGADFAASTSSPSNAFTAAADFNTVAAALTDPGTPLRGTVALQATASSDRGVQSVRFQSSPAGAGTWTDACQDTTAPYSCAWDTSATADGPRDLRALVTDLAGYQRSSAVVGARIVDNTPPTVALTDPGANLQGTVALSGTAGDAGSGVATWTVQYSAAGAGAWTDACSDATAPYGCSWDTTGATDALYDLRAVARDQAGNATNSATRANVRVDNNGPTVTLADPGAYLRGTVALTATASDPAGVQSVVFERKLTSGGGWTTICTDATAPYSCSFTSTAVADGTYDLRARATDTLSHSNSSTASARVIDNTAPSAANVEAFNGGAIAGRPEAGDSLRLTWSEPIAPASVLAGWDGSAVAVRVELQQVSGLDELNVWNGPQTARLNLIDAATDLKLNANVVTTNAWFNATMTRSGAAFTITLGALTSGTVRTGAAANMSWKPSTLATDLAGNAATAVAFAESNPADLDF